MLQAHFSIVRYPALTWSQDQMWEVMRASVIMHNIIIESEHNEPADDNHPDLCEGPLAQVDHEVRADWVAFSP